jgi:hypothetical protein
MQIDDESTAETESQPLSDITSESSAARSQVSSFTAAYDVENMDQDKYKQVQLYDPELVHTTMEDMSDETFLHIAEHIRIKQLVVAFALEVMDPESGFLSKESGATSATGPSPSTNNPKSQRDGPNQEIPIPTNSGRAATPNIPPETRGPAHNLFQGPSPGSNLQNPATPRSRPTSVNENMRGAADAQNEAPSPNPLPVEAFPGSELLSDQEVILFRFDINLRSSASINSPTIQASSNNQWIRIPLLLNGFAVKHPLSSHRPGGLSLIY